MRYYRVIGKIKGTHECDCESCYDSGRSKTKEFDEIVRAEDEEEAAQIVLEMADSLPYFYVDNYNNSLEWVGKPEVSEAPEDVAMAALGETIAPRLPGF